MPVRRSCLLWVRPLAGALLVLLASAPAAQAAVRTWVGKGHKHRWSNHANWLDRARPGADDDVVFDRGSSSSFTL